MRLCMHNVRIDPELFRVLRRARGQQRRRGMPQAPKRDHR